MRFFYKQKTAYDMRISDWSSGVCSSDLRVALHRDVEVAARLGDGAGAHVGAKHFLGHQGARVEPAAVEPQRLRIGNVGAESRRLRVRQIVGDRRLPGHAAPHRGKAGIDEAVHLRSEEHTSELQSLMRISYAVFCLKKKQTQ